MEFPYFRFYPGDYLAKTPELTLEEHGAYCLLLMHYWINGPIENSAPKIARILRISTRKALPILQAIIPFFEETESGKLVHARMDEEIEKINEFREIQSAKGKLGGRPKKKPGVIRGLTGEKPGKSHPLSLSDPLLSKDLKDKTLPEKNRFGEFENVLLSVNEFEKLQEKLNGKLDGLIEELSQGIASKGYRYKSHYATLLSWAKRKGMEGEWTADDLK